MFTTEIRKNGYVVHIKTIMFTTENTGKNGYVVYIKVSIVIVEKTGLVEITCMLYIGNRNLKVPESFP